MKSGLLSMQVARLLGEVLACFGRPLAADGGKSAAELSNRNDLVATLVALKHGEGLASQSLAARAWEALMQRRREADGAAAADMDTS